MIGRMYGGEFIHRTWWKVAINAALRVLQVWFTDRPWVIYSWINISTTPPTLVGYGFGRVKHLPPEPQPPTAVHWFYSQHDQGRDDSSSFPEHVNCAECRKDLP